MKRWNREATGGGQEAEENMSLKEGGGFQMRKNVSVRWIPVGVEKTLEAFGSVK